MTEERSCCGYGFPKLIPQFFSFNSPIEMCKARNGIGQLTTIDENKMIPKKNTSISMGGVLPWENYFDANGNKKDMCWGLARINVMENC